MKLVVVLAVLCCLAIGAFSSPVPKISEEKTSAQNVVATGRQAAQPPAVSEDDDDDDDDDDDVDFDITGDEDDDDDDDDDEDDDDDDDGDYLERFIEDILGGEEDDDDDDEPSAAQPAAIAPVQPIATPSLPAAVEADLNSAAQEAEASAAESAEDGAVGESDDTTGLEDDEGNIAGEGLAASNIHESTIEGAESISNPVVHVPVASTNVAENEDEDDDDDDDDDVDLVYTEDDDDDDDDEDEDDEDDDDVDSIADIADARRARAMESEPSGHVSAIYVAKYNRFVDNILGRINKILRTNYDPVTVKLTNPNSSSKSGKYKIKSKSKRKGTKNGSKKSASGSKTTVTEKTIQDDIKTAEKTMVASESTIMPTTVAENEVITLPTLELMSKSSTEASSKPETRRVSSSSNKKTNKNRTGSKTKTKVQSTSGISNKNKTKSKSKPKARATLYGLATLQRSGDVSVNMMSDHTTIKTKFTLGPLILKVEKEFGRAAKKELRSATATTAEMSGKLNLRVLHGGAATLNSIRVLQPKQVRVESADDHDRTREFVWRRSSHIAHLVSQKLSLATRSMLRPAPDSAIAA